MTSNGNKSKQWQFGLRWLLLATTFLPVVIGLAGGAFGEPSQRAFLYVAGMFLWITLLMLSVGGLMFVVAIAAFHLAKLVYRDCDD